MFPGTTGQEQPCQEGRPGAGDPLAWFRREFYRCLWRRGGALAELTDAMLTASGRRRRCRT